MSKIAVGLSGGVDSGTTALLLKKQGHEVIGVTMWLFDHQSSEIESARQIAKCLEIEHLVLDYRTYFNDLVIKNFHDAYAQGNTPNPCLICNEKLKYGRLIEDAVAHGAEYFSTGHYAKCVYNQDTGEYELYRSENKRKDQSYNLYHLNQETLSRLIFPLGDMESKAAVRETFASYHLELAEKKDSMGICFIEHKNHALYLKEHSHPAMSPGDFVLTTGEIVGHHQGTAHFTIGQKRRLGKDLNGQYLNGKYVVTELNAHSQIVTLGSEEDLLYHTIDCEDFNLISPKLQASLLQESPDENTLEVSVIVSQWSAVYEGKLCIVKSDELFKPELTVEVGEIIHSNSSKTTCLLENKKIKTAARLTFESPVRAPSKGQALVCYIGDRLIGGGIITSYK